MKQPGSKRPGPSSLLVVSTATVLLGALCTAWPVSAAAAPVDEARDRFNRGVQLFHEGSLEAALAEFNKAYQLAPSYRLHYNIAQVQYELHDFVEALRSFWKYLAQGGNDVPAERRNQVEAEIRKLEKRVAYLTITTNVTGAQISVDGVPMGISPFTAPVLVNPGARRVSTTKAGFLPASSTVTAAGGEKLKVALTLVEGSLVAGGLAARPSPFDEGSGGGGRVRAKTWISLAATGAMVIGASAFALATRDAEDDFELELAQRPNTRDNIDGARRRMTRFAAVTDVLAIAAAAGAACTIYFALTENGPRMERDERSASPRHAPILSLSPTPGGVLLGGRF